MKNKSYIIINTLGLGISLSCCITAYLLLAYNIEFDNFHDAEKVSNVFRIHTHSTENDGKRVIDDQAPLVMAPVMIEEIAGIDLYTRFLSGGGALRYGDKVFNEGIAFSDSSFFDMFEYPLVAGSHGSFKEKNSIFITEEITKKYFGNEDPIGKMMVFNGVNETEIELLVGGVIKRFPANNTFKFKIMMRIENYIEMNKIAIDDWSDTRNPSTFIKLTSAENSQQIGKALGRYIQTRNKVRTDMVVDSYELVPFISNFSQDDIRSREWANRRVSMIPLVLFTSMAAMILLIACFNLTNTSIAMTAKRLKEVGIRKAIGAARAQIVIQFLVETFITILLALIVGLFVAQLFVPAFVSMWRLPYSQTDLDGVNLFIALIILVFLVALVAGIYPAMYSSKFKPTILIKGNVKVTGNNMFTKSLVAAQFALSVIELIAGVLFYLNARYQDRIQFGYDKDQVITLNIMGDRDFETMSNAIAGNPKIIEVAASDGNLGGDNYPTPVHIGSSKYEVPAIGVGKNYFETMGLRFVEGRPFNVENSSDQMEGVIVNKAFVEKTGLHDPLEKTFILHDQKRIILGVIENHVDNMHRSKDPEPFVFYPTTKSKYVLMLVKGEKEDLPEIKGYLEKAWKDVFPTRPFESQFQDEAVMGRGREINANFKKIFLFITVVGGLLSAAGIYALASLNIAKRTKEIGIRKALGASIGNILTLLNREFVIVLSVAAVLGSLAGYFLTDTLLTLISVFHIPVGIIPVTMCALVIFGIGILTTSATIMKAAKSNPVDTLRTE